MSLSSTECSWRLSEYEHLSPCLVTLYVELSLILSNSILISGLLVQFIPAPYVNTFALLRIDLSFGLFPTYGFHILTACFYLVESIRAKCSTYLNLKFMSRS
jgi:hypothetical protein